MWRPPQGSCQAQCRVPWLLMMMMLPSLAQVVSSKNPRTIIVAFDSFSEHKIYRKRVRKTSRIVAHDEAQEAKAGDYVQIVPCVPISKTKRHKLDTIVKKFEYYVDESTGYELATTCISTAPRAPALAQAVRIICNPRRLVH